MCKDGRSGTSPEYDKPVLTRRSLILFSAAGLLCWEQPVIAETKAVTDLEKEAAARTARDTFSGTLLVAKHGRGIAQRAYGLADREKNLPATLDTQYRIGSMNKMFTAVCALQLVEAGKLSLDKPIGDYLTDYANKDVASKVTLRQLLSHTGGTGDVFGPELEKNREQLRTLKDYVNLYANRGLKFEPGTKWEYSNFGFLLAGLLIEQASGMSYYEYVRKKVFMTANMTATDSGKDEPASKRAIGYTRHDDKWVPNMWPWPDAEALRNGVTAAGGGYSTVGDLLRFSQALESGRLIGKAVLRQATSQQNKTGGGADWGLGFGIGVGWYGHVGGAPGMNGELRIFPRSGYVIAVLANLDPPAATTLADLFASRVPK
jgi:D-alanyl-D-alanine carboxypeptidase